MFSDFQYKQDIWKEYNELFNKYASQNDSYSVNVRLIHMDPETSNLDDIGGSLQNWSSRLTQLNWKIYENVPLFMNAPAITSDGQYNAENLQSFTATMKFIYEPLPNDMLMFYDDPSNTVYHITDVRYHKTIQKPLKVFEIDLMTTPIIVDELYQNLNIISHEYFNYFNKELYDFLDFRSNYLEIIENIREIVREVNQYFLHDLERYRYIEFNQLIGEIKRCSKWGAITYLYTPLGLIETSDDIIYIDDEEDLELRSNLYILYEKLNKLKEIVCQRL